MKNGMDSVKSLSDRGKKSKSERRLKLPKLRFGPSSPLRLSPIKEMYSPRAVNAFLSPSSSNFIQLPKSSFIEELIKRHNSLLPNDLNHDQHNKKQEFSVMWSKLEANGLIPEARSGAHLIPFANTVYLFSGERSDPLPDLRKLSYSTLTWEKILPSPYDAPTSFRSQIALPYKDFFIVYGGYDYFDSRLNIRNCSSLIYFYNTLTNSWKSFKPIGNCPEPRGNHCGCMVGESLVVFSGQNSRGEYLHDVAVLDVKNLQWSSQDVAGELPSGRTKASLTSIYSPETHKANGFNFFSKVEGEESGNGVYLYGGKGEKGELFSDLYLFKSMKRIRSYVMVWSKIHSTGGPIGRYDHSAAGVGKYLVIFGGRNDQISVPVLNDLHLYNTKENAWQTVAIHGEIPPMRFAAAAAAFGTKLLIFGGMNLKGFVPGCLYELETNQRRVLDCISPSYTF